VLAAVGIGLAGELSALGLLATGGWLLLSASLRPPILLLSIAIGAVRLFSLLRGTARYAERLASHDLGLRALAQLAARERALGACTRAAAAAVGFGRAACALAGGAGLAGVAGSGAAAVRSGRIGPVELGVLVFLALGTAALLQGLPDAAGRLPVSRASLDRLAASAGYPCQ